MAKTLKKDYELVRDLLWLTREDTYEQRLEKFAEAFAVGNRSFDEKAFREVPRNEEGRSLTAYTLEGYPGESLRIYGPDSKSPGLVISTPSTFDRRRYPDRPGVEGVIIGADGSRTTAEP